MRMWELLVVVLAAVLVGWAVGSMVTAANPAQYGPTLLTREQYDAIMRDHAPGQPAQVWKLGPFKTQQDCERAARRLGVKLDCTVGGQ